MPKRNNKPLLSLVRWFPKTVKECESELTRHYPEKEDSWRRMPLRALTTLLHQSLEKFETAMLGWEESEWGEADDQLIDFINLAFMVLERRAPLKKLRKSAYVKRVKK